MERIDDKLIYVFDACNLINIYNIDEDSFILNNLFRLNLYISEKVFSEVQENIYKKYELFKLKKISYDREKRENIDDYLARLRSRVVSNAEIKKDLGSNFDEFFKFCLLPPKENGESVSSGLALKLSREHESRVLFFTDDYKAKTKIANYFHINQIGFICDSSDLLMFLYWRVSNFRRNELIGFLTSLASEYKINLQILLKLLVEYKSNATIVLRREKILFSKLNDLIQKIETLNFNGISDLYLFFSRKRKKYQDIYKILATFEIILDLESNQNESQIQKIQNLIQYLERFNIYKLA